MDGQNEFEKLYKKYYKLLYSVINSKIDNIDDIDDCIQETFLYYYEKYDGKNNKYSKKETKNLLATIANGYAIQKIRKNSHSVDAGDDLDVLNFQKEITFSDINASELAILIDEELEEEERNFLYLTYIYGYKSHEIGEMYGLTPDYVRKHIQLAKTKIREKLNND